MTSKRTLKTDIDALAEAAAGAERGTDTDDMASLVERYEELTGKGDNRTAAETDELAELYLDILEARDDPMPESTANEGADG